MPDALWFDDCVDGACGDYRSRNASEAYYLEDFTADELASLSGRQRFSRDGVRSSSLDDVYLRHVGRSFEVAA